MTATMKAGKFAGILLLAMGMATTFCFCAEAKNRIEVNKKEYKLRVLDEDDSVLFETEVCLGENKGNKRRAGDHKTPEGNFTVCSIENSSSWTHKDKSGKRSFAYGPWFFRLKVPVSRHIGIHGTDEPESIGTRASEGCVRLRNDKLLELRKFVYVGMPVTILPDF